MAVVDSNLVHGQQAHNRCRPVWQLRRTLGGAALRSDELGDRHPDVATDLAQQGGRDITPRMHGDGRDAAVGVAELLVRAALADLDEPEPLEAGDHLARLKDRDRAHGRQLGDEDGLRADELRLQRRLAVLEEHGDDLAKVGVEFVETVPLAVGAREPRDIPDEDAGLRVPLDDGGVSAHMR